MTDRPRSRRSIATVTDAEGVVWTVRAEERRSAVLSLDRQAPSVSREDVLLFTSEFGEVRRALNAGPITGASGCGSPEDLRATFARSAAVRRQAPKHRSR